MPLKKKEERQKYIRDTTSNLPPNPEATLLSRRRSDFPDPEMQMRCDAIVFPLANSVLIDPIRLAQEEIEKIIQTDMVASDERLSLPIDWSSFDKATRRAMKFYKIQKNPHLSFSGSVKPCTIEEYLETKIAQRFIPEQITVYDDKTDTFEKFQPIIPSHLTERRNFTDGMIKRPTDSLQKVFSILRKYAETQPQGKIKECKLNPDGHIVVRVSITPADKLLQCKTEISAAFGESYVRYTDPEKQTTLATVIAVVDINRLSESARERLRFAIYQLDCDLKAKGSFPLSEITWVEFENRRTLSANSLTRQRFFFSESLTKVSGIMPPLP